jgi:hypothetical protein
MVFGKYLYCANTKSSRGQEGICAIQGLNDGPMVALQE